MIYTILAFVVLFMLLELPGLWKRACRREILLVAILLAVSTAYGIACQYNSTMLPNPKQCLYIARPLADAFQSIAGMGDDIP